MSSKGLDGVRRVYARGATEYDARWSRYLDRTISRTVQAVPARPGGRLLDVGCGSGILLERLLDREPTLDASGADASPEMLEVARRRLLGRARLVLADAAALPFPAGTFDLVTTTSSLHHWTEPETVLAEIARVLAPGGTLVLTDWRADHLPTRVLDLALRLVDPSHRRAVTMSRARRLIEAAGLRTVSWERYGLGWRWGFMTVVAVAEGP